MSETIRSFIAVELTEKTHLALGRIQGSLCQAHADVKWVNPKNIHLTLRFLGNVNPKKLKAIEKDLSFIFKGNRAFPSDITHLGAFPRFDRPRVIWAGVGKNSDKISELAAELENYLCILGLPKDEKAFVPHLTLGRVRSLKNASMLGEKVKNYELASPITQEIKTITLFKSTLTSQGPVYETQETTRLTTAFSNA